MENTASNQVRCDACNAKIGEYYPNTTGSIAVSLNDDKGNSKTNHFCDEDCMRNKLNSRAASKQKKAAIQASTMELDIAADVAAKKAAAK